MSESLASVVQPPTAIAFEGEGWRLRCAGPADSAALNGLLEDIPFGGSISLTEDRMGDPGLLRALEAHKEPHAAQFFVIDDEHETPVGCFSMVARRARLGADVVVAAHIADLRLAPGHREARTIPSALRVACDLTRERTGAEVFFSACLGDDLQAFAALTRRDERRYEQPMAQVMQQVTLGVIPVDARPSESTQRRIERGSTALLEEISEFLSRQHAVSTLGHDLSPSAFAERLHHATGGDLDRLILVRESGGALACCAAVLSTGALRRFSLGRVTGPARSRARWFNLKSWTGGYPRLPIKRGPQAVLQLGFYAQRDDDPGPLRDLLIAALDEPWNDEARWLTVAVPQQSQSLGALQALPCFTIPVSLLALTRAGTRWNNVDFRTQRCGIEHVFF